MIFVCIFVVAALGTVSADVSHLLAASLAAGPSSRYIPPIPNALRSAAPISNFISHGDIGAAAQTQSASVLPAPAPTPDSATQGPNPQDIATPEPEYIDIELPFPEPPPRKAAPRPPAPRKPAPAPLPPPRPRLPAPVPRAPVFSPAPNFGQPLQQNYIPPLNEPAPAHTLEADGYHYRIPRRH